MNNTTQYTVVSDLKIVDIGKWDQFIANNPQGNIFQSPEFYKVLLRSRSYYPVGIVVLDQKQLIKGILLGVIMKSEIPFVKNLTSRLIIWGGPILDLDNDWPQLLELLLRKLEKKVKRKIIYTQFRNIYNISKYDRIFEKMGFIKEDHLDILINLDRPWSDILKDIHKSRKRNYTKSKNKGTIFKEIFSEKEIRDAYEVIRYTYKRIKLPVPDITHFMALREYTGQKGFAKFFCALVTESIIGVRIVLVYKDMIYDYYAGSIPNYNNYYPNDFLIMKILEWGHKNGYKLFDFGGAGKPNVPYSVRDFKLQYGKNLVNYGRFVKISKPKIYKIAKTGFTIWQKIKQ